MSTIELHAVDAKTKSPPRSVDSPPGVGRSLDFRFDFGGFRDGFGLVWLVVGEGVHLATTVDE